MIVRTLLSVSLCFSCAAYVNADQTAEQVSQWRQSHEQQIVDRFAELLSIPNVASDKANIRSGSTAIRLFWFIGKCQPTS